jgi:N-acetylneuraminate synthase
MAEIVIAGRPVGPGHPTYVIAEISANHGGSYERAEALVRAAAGAGADAAKLQTYTPDGMTLDIAAPPFVVGSDTLWAGRTLHDLYTEAQTPWDWHAPLQAVAREVGIHLFSAPFDLDAVRFLDDLDVPALKIASFELGDLALVRAAAATGRPLILSTGMATVDDIDEAVEAARGAGATALALLRTNSAYPAPAAEMDLRTIADMAERWDVPVGLSDHTLGTTAAVTAVALGACILEKHITLSRDEATADAAFSLEPAEFADLVTAVRDAEAAVGAVRYGPSERERASLAFRRSLFVVADVAAGEILTTESVRAIRPGGGLAPRHLDDVLGRRAARDLTRGTPLQWDDVEAQDRS